MDLAGRLQQLEELVREAKSMPLSSSVLVNKDEVLEMLHQMQEDLPEEIKQARWIVRDREDLLAKARAEGERVIEHAHEEQRRMALKEEVARRAEEESERILTEAGERADEMRREAEDYIDAKLAQFEIALRRVLEDSQVATRALAKTLDQVEVGRERLRTPGTTADQQLSPPEAPEHAPLFDEEEDVPQG
jgi:cell division septum initiation protein DivIVA